MSESKGAVDRMGDYGGFRSWWSGFRVTGPDGYVIAEQRPGWCRVLDRIAFLAVLVGLLLLADWVWPARFVHAQQITTMKRATTANLGDSTLFSAVPRAGTDSLKTRALTGAQLKTLVGTQGSNPNFNSLGVNTTASGTAGRIDMTTGGASFFLVSNMGLGTTTATNVGLYVNNSNVATLTSTALVSQTDSGIALGTAGNRFSDLRAAMGTVSNNFAVLGDLSIGANHAIGTTTNNSWALKVNGGNVATIQATSINPATDSTNSLGLSTMRWATVFGTGHYYATQVNDTAKATEIGYCLTHTTSTASPVRIGTQNTPTNVDSLILPAGNWEVFGKVNIADSAATSTVFQGGIDSVSATFAVDARNSQLPIPLTSSSLTVGFAVPRYVLRLASTSKIWLIASATFSVNIVKASGTLSACRNR